MAIRGSYERSRRTYGSPRVLLDLQESGEACGRKRIARIYEYQRRLETAGVRPSMSRKGDCYDNAPMESFFGTLKRERVHRRRYWTRDEATADIGDYIDGFYNLTRRHSELRGLSPVQFENRTKRT